MSLNSLFPRQHLMAGAVIAMACPFLFLWFERFLVSGLTTGSVMDKNGKSDEEAINIIKIMIVAATRCPPIGCIPINGIGILGFTALGIWHFNKWRAWLETPRC